MRSRRATTVRGAIDWSGDSTTCSSTPGSMCCPPPSIACSVSIASFHLGITSATIDLAREVSVGEVQKAEDEANRIVWEDRPVAIRIATPDEAANLPLRKASLRSGRSVSSKCVISTSPLVVAHTSHARAPSVLSRLREPISCVEDRGSSSLAVAERSPRFVAGGDRRRDTISVGPLNCRWNRASTVRVEATPADDSRPARATCRP